MRSLASSTIRNGAPVSDDPIDNPYDYDLPLHP